MPKLGKYHEKPLSRTDHSGGHCSLPVFFRFFQAEGVDVVAFSTSMFVNGAAGGISADLLLSSFIFWIFMFQQLRKKSSPKPYAFIALNLLVGLSCALPAYLYVRERPEPVAQ